MFGDLKVYFNLIEQGIWFQTMLTKNVELRFEIRGHGDYVLSLKSKKGSMIQKINEIFVSVNVALGVVLCVVAFLKLWGVL